MSLDDPHDEFDVDPPTQTRGPLVPRERQNTRPLPEVHLPIGKLVDELRLWFRGVLLAVVLLLAWNAYRSLVRDARDDEERAFRAEVLRRLPAR